MIASHDLGIARRGRIAIAWAGSSRGCTLLLRRVVWVGCRASTRGSGGRFVGVVGRAVVHVAVRRRLRGLAMAAVVHKHVDATMLNVGWQVLVVIVIRRFRVRRDDVPRVEEARDIAQDEQ